MDQGTRGYRIGETNRAKIENDPQLRSLICLQCGYLLKDPTVLRCRHRFCRTCVESLCVSGSSVTVACPIDGHHVKLEECHRDKLAITQINNLDLSCEIETCHWHGRVSHLEEHMKDFHNSYKAECAKEQLTGYDELRQQLNTFQHKVQTLEEQNLHQDGELERLGQEQQEAARKIMDIEEMLRLQKDQCGKYHNECLAESGRACEERNMEVVILQCSISCLEKQLDDLQKKYAALQTRHADLENRHTDLQNRHADLQYRHDTLQAQVTLS